MAAEVKYIITAEDRTSGANDSAIGANKKLINSFTDIKAVLDVVAQAWNGVKRVMDGLVDAYSEQLRADTKLQAILKSTGNQINSSTQALKDFATQMQDLTGISDTAVEESQALLLTFTKIGGDVFPRATKAALDMSEIFGSVQQASIQIGKALQEPVQGVSALRRVGVQLSDQQEKMIEQFMAVNDIASAQGVILGELETQFGGLAQAIGDTFIGSARRLKNNLADIMEVIGGEIAEFLKPGMDKINQFLQDHRTQITNILQNLPEVFRLTFDTLAKLVRRTFEPATFTDVFLALGGALVSTFSMALRVLPEQVAALFSSGGSIIQIIVGNMALAIGEGFRKGLSSMFGVEIGYSKADEKRIAEIQAGIQKAGKNLDLQFSSISRNFASGFAELTQIWSKAGGDIKDNYLDIFNAWGKAMDEIMGREIKPVADLAGTASGAKAAVGQVGQVFDQFEKERMDFQLKYTDMLYNLSHDRIQIFEREYMHQWARAVEIGADLTDFEAYYAKARTNLWMDEIAKKKKASDEFYEHYIKTWGGVQVAHFQAPEKEKEQSFGQVAGAWAMDEFTGALMEAVGQIESLNALMHPFNTIMQAVVATASMAVNSALAPLVGMLVMVGNVIGAIVVPVFNALSPVIQLLAVGFVWLYNNAIRPLANLIIGTINVIGIVIGNFVNAVIAVLNIFGAEIKALQLPKNVTAGMLEKITLSDLNAAAATAMPDYAAATGAGAQYTAGRTLNITINIERPIIIDDTDLSKLAESLAKYIRMGEEVS